MKADIIVVGAGPAGLMAAETARACGAKVVVIEAMGSAGRKFLIAGKGGLNLTHSEASEAFLSRYAAGQNYVAGWLRQFGAPELRAWASALGFETIIGSSGRVFPSDLKAGPMMRAWLRRLRAQGVEFCYHTRCQGLRHGSAGIELTLASEQGTYQAHTRSVIFSMGGGSWAKLGSDGAWQGWLAEAEIAISPLQPSNCGFEATFSTALLQHAGSPIKPVCGATSTNAGELVNAKRGELMLSEYGLEGGLIYALSAPLRKALAENGGAVLWLDLCPDQSAAQLLASLTKARAGQSLSEKIKRCAKLSPVKLALFYEFLTPQSRSELATNLPAVVARLKALAVPLQATRAMDEAISTAGGVQAAQLSAQLMYAAKPGIFFAGEMIDWDAPTGGYLLTACFASGYVAGRGAATYLQTLT